MTLQEVIDDIQRVLDYDLVDRPLNVLIPQIRNWQDAAADAMPGPPVVNIPGGWVALTPYLSGDLIAQVDPVDAFTYVWQNQGADGSTGASLPVFDHTATPVVDAPQNWVLVGVLG